MRNSLEFFYKYMIDDYYINFFGGEPLLNFKEIENVVVFLKKKSKKVNFSLTTNASMINNKILEFLDNNKFSIQVSFDGYAHNLQRKSNDFDAIKNKIEKIAKYKNIKLSTNSVFTPKTIHFLSKSISLLIDLGIQEIDYSLSIIDDWDSEGLKKYKNELNKIEKLLIRNYSKNRRIPVSIYDKTIDQKGIFKCSAGKKFITIDTNGDLWGCFMFFDYYKKQKYDKAIKKFSFGNIYEFIKDYKDIHKKVLNTYSILRNDYYKTTDNKKCYLCENLKDCRMCPLNGAFYTGKIGLIGTWMCKANKIKNNSISSFKKKIFSTNEN